METPGHNPITMITVGITGGIGSGKSTICRLWQEMGATVVFADDLAKELMENDAEIREKISAAFGEQSYHTNGALNRGYLAKEAFEKGRVAELNNIVHPVVYKATQERREQARKEGAPVFVKEAALLLKEGRPAEFDCIVLVLAPEKDRITRVLKRDNAHPEDVVRRMQAQQNFEELSGLADVVIRNTSDIEALRKEATKLFELWTTR